MIRVKDRCFHVCREGVTRVLDIILSVALLIYSVILFIIWYGRVVWGFNINENVVLVALIMIIAHLIAVGVGGYIMDEACRRSCSEADSGS